MAINEDAGSVSHRPLSLEYKSPEKAFFVWGERENSNELQIKSRFRPGDHLKTSRPRRCDRCRF